MSSRASSVQCQAAAVLLLCLTLGASSKPLQASDGYCLLSYGTVLRRTVAEHKADWSLSREVAKFFSGAVPEHKESNATPGMQAKVHHDSMPLAAWRAFEAVADSKRELLEKGSEEAAEPWFPNVRGSVFEAVEVSLPLEPPVLKHSRFHGSGQGDKNIVGLSQLTRGGRRCVVYGMGIADDSSFEQHMQQLGCETHAFDCTVGPTSKAIVGKSFHFHNWCIGRQGGISFADNKYVHGNEDALQFKTLPETMKELNHTHIDLLKFDIEGFEWQLFQDQILTSDNPPEQLSFELHTQKANPAYVPHGNVHDKGYVEVNRLFRSLYDLGYRVTSKELNSGDPACAEFVAVRVNRDDA